MKDVKLTRDLFLWCMSATYFFAFASFYHQIPGLYGDNGILPVKLFLGNASRPADELLAENPTLLWLYSKIGLDPQLTLDLVALSGAIISLLALLSARLRSTLTFALLWILYLSIVNVGQTFLWFQWDILLLEAGFLTLIVAPLNLLPWKQPAVHPHDGITMWLVRWLLFRLMFASGVVKLTSQCPTWWGLTALTHHFESQCIPTVLAWYVHHLPEWVLKLGVVSTYVAEIAIPFLFFSPTRSARIFSFYIQVLLQIGIILTGNYNYFNFLTIALSISLLDDQHLHTETVAPTKKRNAKKAAARKNTLMQTLQNSFSKLVTFAVLSALVYWTIALFALKVKPDFTIDSKIAFTNQDLNFALEKAVKASVYIGVISLALKILVAIYRSLYQVQGIFKKFWSVLGCVVFGAIAAWIFCISLVPHASVDPQVHAQLFPVLKNWHGKVEQYHLVNSYGLFRRMTGVGGRPEIVVEGSDSASSGWKEYEFLYKPGHIMKSPQIAAPHQPRLDWQMWFAALGSYQDNPWFISFVNRLLNGQSEVLDLLDKGKNPFPKGPPKYIRATKYIYRFSEWKDGKSGQWWTRKKAGEYLPPITKDDPSVVALLKNHKLIQDKSAPIKVKNDTLRRALTVARQWTSRVEAPTILWSIFLAALVSRVVSPARNHSRP